MILDPRDISIERRFEKIRYSVLIASGKGGVGKSLFSSILALVLSKKGFKVGLLDLDIHGPAIPTILRLEGSDIEESKHGILPPKVDNLKVMSIAFLAKNEPLPLRGESKTNVIKEILAITNWESLDFLIVDLPPGTGDEVLSSIKYIKNKKGVIIITVPSLVSLAVVERAIRLFHEIKVPIIALVNNMSHINIKEKTLPIFGNANVRKLLEKYPIETFVEIPVDMEINVLIEKGNTVDMIKTVFAQKIMPIATFLARKLM